MQKTKSINKTICYHCGEPCIDELILQDDKPFCCNGCKLVFELLQENGLCTYYNLEQNPGYQNKVPFSKDRFNYLDDPEIQQKLIDFRDNKISKTTFFIPSIHCSSCIWLLEKLYKLNSAVISSEVNFVSKKATITFDHNKTSLRQVVELLASIGYEPKINYNDLDEQPEIKIDRSLFIKIGLAGFAFGNSMLLSFPEYLDIGNTLTEFSKKGFGYLNIFLSVPVLFYSASDFYISAFKGLRKKILNIDVPIALGITVLLARSLYEIFSGSGPGYLDSFNGLIFFLLLGRLFQEKTYATLSFERDYKSYFPVSVTLLNEDKEKTIALSKLKVGDLILLRNQELIPADSLLLSDEAFVDYSFVTGESDLIRVSKNEIVYAGGRLNGASVQIRTIKKVSQSYLTQLWNNEIFSKKDNVSLSRLSDKVAAYFTYVILLISLVAGMYWSFIDYRTAIDVVSAILIVACPCALALSIPFTFGNVVRIFSRAKFYLKNARVVERMFKINHIVFDKTGTLTWQKYPEISFNGSLTNEEKSLIKSAVKNSIHPLSRYIFNSLDVPAGMKVQSFKEFPGKGIQAKVSGNILQIGSSLWLGQEERYKKEESSSLVYVWINKKCKGAFQIKNNYRPGLTRVLGTLAKRYRLALLSGDNENEKSFFQQLFIKLGISGSLLFNQSPQEKQNFITRLQSSGAKTLMIGDGLNDAGALRKSDLGISISEDINAFSPACDAILEAESFYKLPLFLIYARYAYFIVMASFILSFLYNGIGLSFAITGHLSPLIAAILMPLSSISVVVFTTITTRYAAKKMGLV